MGVRLGPFDPLQLIFETINHMVSNKLMTIEQARNIISRSLDPKIPEEEREKILNSLIKKKKNG